MKTVSYQTFLTFYNENTNKIDLHFINYIYDNFTG